MRLGAIGPERPSARIIARISRPILADTRFRIGETIAVEGSHELTASDLAYRVLTLSGSSPAVLSDKADAMLHDVEQRLLPFSRAGLLRRSS
jgi:hypothetical protein